jgi:hypothetical protein
MPRHHYCKHPGAHLQLPANRSLAYRLLQQTAVKEEPLKLLIRAVSILSELLLSRQLKGDRASSCSINRKTYS